MIMVASFSSSHEVTSRAEEICVHGRQLLPTWNQLDEGEIRPDKRRMRFHSLHAKFYH